MGTKTASEGVLEAARLAAARGELRFTSHARDQMRARNAKVYDVLNAVDTATLAERQPNGTWRLYGGSDLDDCELIVVVDVRDGVVVVTVMG